MINVAVIGAGYWGINHVRTFNALTSCNLASVADLSQDNLERVKGISSSVHTTDDYTQILNDKAIDAVVIATDAGSHFTLASEAIKAGKHVLVEKPLALTAAEGESLINQADSSGRTLMVGHILLYHPAVARLKEYVSSGELGDVYYISTQRVNLGVVRATENALWSLGPHDISIMLYLTGEEPQEVSASGRCYVQKDIEDVVFFWLRFPGAVMGHGHVSWLDPHKIRKLTVVGSQKMAVFDDVSSTEKIRVYDKGVTGGPASYGSYGESISVRHGDVHVPYIKMVEPLRAECQHFVECVEKGTRPLTDGRDGLRVLKVLEAAQQSLRGGGVPSKIAGG
jgi:predicted dehydrogenase